MVRGCAIIQSTKLIGSVKPHVQSHVRKRDG